MGFVWHFSGAEIKESESIWRNLVRELFWNPTPFNVVGREIGVILFGAAEF